MSNISEQYFVNLCYISYRPELVRNNYCYNIILNQEQINYLQEIYLLFIGDNSKKPSITITNLSTQKIYDLITQSEENMLEINLESTSTPPPLMRNNATVIMDIDITNLEQIASFIEVFARACQVPYDEYTFIEYASRIEEVAKTLMRKS